MNRIAESLGKFIRKFLHTVVSYLHFVWQLFKSVPGAFSNFHTTVEQMQHVGLTSIPVVVAASLATGGDGGTLPDFDRHGACRPNWSLHVFRTWNDGRDRTA